MNGTFNEMINFNGAAALETPEFLMARLDEFGGPDSYNHYSVGWAHAMDTPCQWTKQVASHWGGTRNGTIVHWPNGFTSRGQIRSQFHHVIDLAPTVLEAAGLPEPVTVNGVQQMPLQGVSMRYSFDDGHAADRHETQYFEMFGNRGIYHKGWTAVTKHKTPWILIGEQAPAFDDDVWELYDTTADWSQARDLSRDHPDKLHELQRLWLIEATRYGVLPLDDRVGERLNPELAGRPMLITGNSQLLFGGMGRLSEHAVVSIKNKSHSVTAEVVADDGPADGVIIAQGGSIAAGACMPRTASRSIATTSSAFSTSTSRATSSFPPGSIRCGWSSPTTTAASARAAQSACISTATSAARDASMPRPPWCSPPTTRATLAERAAPWSPPSTGRTTTGSPASSTGSR